jgi:hypothetical protein
MQAEKVKQCKKKDRITMTRHLKETFSLAPCLEALGMDSEFLLGDDILVAPVLEEGLTARHATQQPIT